MDTLWGFPLEAWYTFGACAIGWGFQTGMKMWWHFHPIPQAWCQGCDQLQPSACFRWNSIGLYRCGNCLSSPPLLDMAKEISASRVGRASDGGQFAAITHDRYLDWRCQCGKVATLYEWETGRRYCQKHGMEQPLRIKISTGKK